MAGFPRFLGFVLLFVCSLRVQAEVDYTNYDTPVYDQIRKRIQAKVLRRLGGGINRRDRFFIVPFAYQNKGNDPEFSHSFLSVIRVFADHRPIRSTTGMIVREHKNRKFEAFTISWLPADFLKNPNLIVFQGAGARIDPKANTAPLSPGKSFTLEETIGLGANVKNAIVMWGPYEIQKKGFDLAVARVKLLNRGTIKYRADDRLYRKDQVAINCFHAISGLEEPYPNGGLFGTGFMMWGINGTSRVLIEYANAPRYEGLLLEPVDYKKDRYAFVYAPEPNSSRVYAPVENASAYRR